MMSREEFIALEASYACAEHGVTACNECSNPPSPRPCPWKTLDGECFTADCAEFGNTAAPSAPRGADSCGGGGSPIRPASPLEPDYGPHGYDTKRDRIAVHGEEW